MSRSLAAPLACLLAAGAVGACGGGNDKSDAEQTVKDFVKAANDRDGDKFCGQLVTQEFLEQSTGATGDKAEDACKQQLKSLRGFGLKLIEIKKTEVNGDKATVTAVFETQGQRQQNPLRLKKDGGRFKIAGGSGN